MRLQRCCTPRSLLLAVATSLLSPAALAQTAMPIFINELHYDNAGADTGEAVEIAGPAGSDISTLTLVPYNGSNGASYTPIGSFSGSIPNMQAGFGTVSVNITGLQNGAPDGIALVRGGTQVLQFLCYEGTFTATNGPAAGMTCSDIGQQELGTEAVGGSLQLAGSGSQYADFSWQPVAANTFGQVNRGQTFVSRTVDEPPAVASITPMNNATAVPVTSGVVVSFTEPVSTSSSAFALSCEGLPQAFNFSGSGSSYTLTPAADLPSMQRCTLGIAASGVMDQDAPLQPMAADFSSVFTTGASTACGAPATLISAVQGKGAATPLANQMVQIEGVVVGDFQGPSGLSGFYLQEETVDQDGDPLSSEGVFVFDRNFGVDVAPNDVVRVAGTVREQFGQTELFNPTVLRVCSRNSSALSATPVTLPFAATADLEAFEGMLVTLPQKLAVTSNFTLARFGEVELSSGSRLVQPTQVATPGAAAVALQASNNLNRLLIDDANSQQNRDPVVYPGTGLSAFNTLRGGDTVSDVTGVMGYGFNVYRVQPTETPLFVAENPRTAAPALPGLGSLRVASFNVLNYFNGNGAGAGFPTSRGADTLAEFNRQRYKIIAAISALDADVIGLIEIENDGHGSASAIADLVNGLNSAAPAGTRYAFVDVGGPFGTDEISVGFVYRVETVAPAGAPAILDSRVDARFIDTKNRPALAQTFRELATNARFTAAVNHFKSKGSACDDVGDPDLFDGAGNCNGTRRNAARALVDWLATDPTKSGDPDFLIIGDLNSYAQEEPIQTLRAGGYTNLVDVDGTQNPPELAYSFDGQWGTLDYGLANARLLPQVTAATEWLINGAEPVALDYNTEFKSANQQALFYNADPYRSSDHDPVVIELALCGPGTLSFAGAPYQVQEGDGEVRLTVTVSRSNGSCGAVGVSYAARAGNGAALATAGLDFVETSGVLNWADGETASKRFEVVIKPDALDEADELFGLALAGTTGGALLPEHADTLTTTATIVDNDASPTVRFSAANDKVYESDGLVTVALELSAVSGRDVIVPLTFAGSATRDGLTGDYSVNGVDGLDRVVIPSGSRSALVTLQLVDDTAREPHETIELAIAAGVLNAEPAAPARFVLTVKDKDKKVK